MKSILLDRLVCLSTLLVFVAIMNFLPPQLCSAPDNRSTSNRAYLLSVSFSVPMLQDWTKETVAGLLATPYDGVAARLHSAYWVGSSPSETRFARAVALIRRSARGRHVWPWIFLNRIIARSKTAAHKNAPKAELESEKGFPGADINGSGGALYEFYRLWRLGLRLAKELGAPGIVFDPECYSNYSVGIIPRLAQMRGVSDDDVRRQTSALGAKLADIAAEEYPDAIIWSLFTRIERESSRHGWIPCLFDGLLRRAAERNIPLKVVDGGETVGYCALNLAHFQRMHDIRVWRLRGMLERYHGKLVLGGTLAPWADASKRTSWLSEWPDAKNSELQTINDFEPLFVELLRRYRWVWIYGASAAPYQPLKPRSAAPYNLVLDRALTNAVSLGPKGPGSLLQLDTTRDVQRLTPNFASDKSRWSVHGGPEAKLAFPAQEPGIVRFEVNVNHKNGNQKYPEGWLFLNCSFGKQYALDAHAFLVFEIRFHQEGFIRVGLRSVGNKGIEWQDIRSGSRKKVGVWREIRMPVALLTSTDASQIVGAALYVAERWYAHGQRLVFDVRKVYLAQLKEAD